MLHAPIARGAVVQSGAAFWLVWGADAARPVCLPIKGQAAPRSRWEVRLPRGDAPVPMRASMVCAAEARPMDARGLTLVAQLAKDTVAAIEAALRRAAESERIEAAHAM